MKEKERKKIRKKEKKKERKKEKRKKEIYMHMKYLIKYNIAHIREYGSTLYVGLARAVSPTNTNFRLTFLLTRLQEALYEDLAV